MSGYRLNADISLQPVADAAVAAVVNDSAGDIQCDGICVPDPRNPELGRRLVGTQSELARAGAITAREPLHMYEQKRIMLAVPDGAYDFISGKSLLLEYGFDTAGAIDWDKGCYLGQEVTARTRYRGLLKRRFVALQCQTGAAVAGDEVCADTTPGQPGGSRRLGTITSVAGVWAAARLRLEGGQVPEGILRAETRAYRWHRP